MSQLFEGFPIWTPGKPLFSGFPLPIADAAGIDTTFRFKRMANPAALPSSARSQICLSNDANRLIMELAGSTSLLDVYTKSGSTFIKKTSGVPSLSQWSYKMALSADGRVMAAASAYSTYWRLWLWNTDGSFTEKTLSGQPSDDGTDCALSSDGTYAAFCSDYASKSLSVYKRQADNSYVKLSTPSNPGWACSSVAFSPDDQYLAVGLWESGYTPFMNIYKRNGDTFTVVSTITNTWGAGYQITDCWFSPDGQHLILNVNSNTAPRIYKKSGDSFVYLSLLAVGSASTAGITFSPDGKYLLAIAGGVKLFDISGDTYTLRSDFDVVTAASGIRFSPGTGKYYLIASATDDTFQQYE